MTGEAVERRTIFTQDGTAVELWGQAATFWTPVRGAAVALESPRDVAWRRLTATACSAR